MLKNAFFHSEKVDVIKTHINKYCELIYCIWPNIGVVKNIRIVRIKKHDMFVARNSFMNIFELW